MKSKNLIIDVRNNTGGSDGSFSKLLSFLYTNPTWTYNEEYFSTPLNNQRMLDFIHNPEYGFDDEGKKWAQEMYDTLENHIGKFVGIFINDISFDERDTVYLYPKNIGIIINGRCASSTEEFLLKAKQSMKVKLFGSPTFGADDVGNMYSVESPCNEFILSYCLSRRLRSSGVLFDDFGYNRIFI